MFWYAVLTICSLMLGSFTTYSGAANSVQSSFTVANTAPADLATFPSGRFTTTITAQDVTNPDLASNVGYWVITFEPKNTASGSYNVTVDDMLIANGHYHLKQQQITFSDDSLACRGAGNGRYSWTFDGSQLTLTPIEDRCEPRKFVLSVHPYTLQP